MKKMKIALILALGLGLIIPQSFAAEEKRIEEDQPVVVDDEVIRRWVEFEPTKVTVKLNGVAKEIKAVAVTPYSQYKTDPEKDPGIEYMISLRDLATAVKGTDLRFDITKMDGEDFRVTKGVDYKGSDSTKKVPDGRTGTMPTLKVNNKASEKPKTDEVLVVHEAPHASIDWYDGEYYMSPDTLELLDFRVSRDITDPRVFTVSSDKSDIKNLNEKEFIKALGNNDYTLVYLYSPDNQGTYINNEVHYPDFRRVEEYAKKLGADDKYNFGTLGLVRFSSKYRNDQLNKMFDGGQAKWKNFGISGDLSPFINQLTEGYNNAYGTFPNRPEYYDYQEVLFIMDKDGKIHGKTFNGYYDQLKELWIQKEIAKDPSKEVEVPHGLLTEVIYHNFIAYAIEGKNPSLDDINAYKKDNLEAQIAGLKKAIADNNIIIGSVNFLVENTPQTIKNVRGKLDDLLKKSTEMQKEANKILEDLEKQLNSL